MQIKAGTRIGSYEVVGELGAGGMGHVYRAVDSRLGREVAIKALPQALARDEQATARFEREARFLASLNHPNIAAIYEIEEQDGERFLVLELVRGETLDGKLAREGRLPVADTIRIAIEIATGLEAAHEAGIVHRDLKPANVRITPDGHVKLLDFGIAKSVEAAPSDLSRAQTMHNTLTGEGRTIGTPAYMSPEQISGAEVDKRTDVWAFGCLLYEMLTGRRAFAGNTYLELADAVRSSSPAWQALPAETPERLQRLLTRCLRKEPRERLHDIADARLELEEIRGESVTTGNRPSLLKRFVLPTALAALVLAVIGGALWKTKSGTAPSASPVQRLTQMTSAEGSEEFPSWARDGKSIVYTAEVGGIRKLFVRRDGASDAEQLTRGEFDDLQPAFSADGSHVLFVRGRAAGRRLEPGDVFGSYESGSGDVWSLDVKSKRETRLVEHAFSPALSPDGNSIAIDASFAGPRRIWIVDSNGLNPQQLTTESSEAVVHILPRWSPDGKWIVYQRIERTKFEIAAVNVATRQSVAVANDNYRKIQPVWSPSGNFIYFSSDRGGGMNVWRVRVDANAKTSGAPQQITTGAGQDVQIALAPDGKRLAYATLQQNADLWRMPMHPDGTLAGAPEQLIATTREDSRGEWSPDGSSIAFNSDRTGDMTIWIASIADRAARQITRGAGGDFQPTWSPDGKEIAFFSSRSGNADIWKTSAETGSLRQLTTSRSLDINPFFSPDGTQIVYQSDASGRLELWMMRADGSAQHQLTSIGVSGHFMRWLSDGYIYFRSPGNGLMRVKPDGGEPELANKEAGAHLSFSPDGSKFIDVTGHQILWLYTKDTKTKLFSFDDPEIRIDYPVWSPDGKWLLFDRFKPQGGDIWMVEGLE